MKRAHPLLLTGLLLASPSIVSAQVRQAAMGIDYTGVLKQRLRNLVRAQEKYWADHGTYTTDASALGIFKPPAKDSVWVQVIQAGGRSWWGRASHRAQPGKSCIIYVGIMEDFSAPPTTDGAKVRAQNEAEPICDPT